MQVAARCRLFLQVQGPVLTNCLDSYFQFLRLLLRYYCHYVLLLARKLLTLTLFVGSGAICMLAGLVVVSWLTAISRGNRGILRIILCCRGSGGIPCILSYRIFSGFTRQGGDDIFGMCTNSCCLCAGCWCRLC